ncbi:hypothetical protein R1sor_019601 [Riccia sorocarpa]|uniref:XS domain-containing protein n=1 Tax=Riccia sorocarpa TaxID=122646 RepID=A0ABD3IG94_9MARC
MYRPAPRFDGRAQEKSSRSTRSAWTDNRSFAAPLEADDGPRSAPYLTEDSLIDRDFQGLRGNDELGPRGNNDLREAQRLAASFFSSQIPPPSSSNSLYRDPRTSRTLSPEVPLDRFGSQTSRQYRERDVNDEQKWANNRSGSQERYLSNRSVTEPEYWEDVDSYGVAGSRSRKAEDNYGWEDVDAQYVARKESDYSVPGDAESARVTRRLDWTGLFREGRDVYPTDSSVARRSAPGSVYGARQFAEAFPGGQDGLVDPEEAVPSSRSRDSVENFRHGRGYLEEVPDGIEPDYGLGTSAGTARSRGGTRDMDWNRSVGRHENKDFWPGGIRNNGFSELNEFPRRFLDGPVGIPFGFANPPVARREFMNPKPDYSVRASLTNRDILGIYYGNSNQNSRKDPPRHGAVPFDRPERLPFGGVPGPWHGPPRPPGGGFNRERDDWGPMRKGKKRWPRSPRAGENPYMSHSSHGKRFKRETEADKLFLMHNSKATLASLNDSQSREKKEQLPHPSAKGKEKEATPLGNDSEKKVEPEERPAERGLWDEPWSDSEEDKVGDRNAAEKERTRPAVDSGVIKELEKEATRRRGVSPHDSADDTAGDDYVLADNEPGGKSLTADADGQEDGRSPEQQTVNADVGTFDTSGNADVGSGVTSTVSQEPSKDRDDERSLENDDLEIFDSDGIVEASRMDSSLDGNLPGAGGFLSEKRLLFESKEAGRSQEDKAYEFYVSVFERDENLRKLYEANSNSGSFECLVCAGVGAKKKKRFPDVTSMIQHAKKIIKTKKLHEHRGFARAVCHILGWDSTVSSPSPKTSNPALAPQDQAQPSTPLNDGSKFQVSKTVPPESNWNLESARRFLEEQLKGPDTDLSVRESVTRIEVDKLQSGSESEGKEVDCETGDAPRTSNALIESSELGDNALWTGRRSVSNHVVLESPSSSLTWTSDGRGENAVSEPTSSTTVNVDGGVGIDDPLPGDGSASVGPVNSGDVTLLKTGVPVLQGTSEQSDKEPAAEVPSVEKYTGHGDDGEMETLSSVALAEALKDGEISFRTETVAESTATYVAGGTSAVVRFETAAGTLPGTVNVEPPEMSFSVLLAMQGGDSQVGNPPEAESIPSDTGC